MILYVCSATFFLHRVLCIGDSHLSVQIKLLLLLTAAPSPIVSMCNPSALSPEDFKVLYKPLLFGLSCLQETCCGWSTCGSELGQALPTNVDAVEAMMPSRISQREQDSCRAKLEPDSGPITSTPPPCG